MCSIQYCNSNSNFMTGPQYLSLSFMLGSYYFNGKETDIASNVMVVLPHYTFKILLYIQYKLMMWYTMWIASRFTSFTGVFPQSLEEISNCYNLTVKCRATLKAQCLGRVLQAPSDPEVGHDVVFGNESNSTECQENAQPITCECGRAVDDPCLQCIKRYKVKISSYSHFTAKMYVYML